MGRQGRGAFACNAPWCHHLPSVSRWCQLKLSISIILQRAFSYNGFIEFLSVKQNNPAMKLIVSAKWQGSYKLQTPSPLGIKMVHAALTVHTVDWEFVGNLGVFFVNITSTFSSAIKKKKDLCIFRFLKWKAQYLPSCSQVFEYLHIKNRIRSSVRPLSGQLWGLWRMCQPKCYLNKRHLCCLH